MSKTDHDLLTILTNALPRYMQIVALKRLQTLELQYKEQDRIGPNRSQDVHESLTRFLVRLIKECKKGIVGLIEIKVRLEHRYSKAISVVEQHDVILDFARELGADEKQLRKDRKALERWFGFDAVRERCLRRISMLEYNIVLYLMLIGSLGAEVLGRASSENRLDVWKTLRLEGLLIELLEYQGDPRVRGRAFVCLADNLRMLDWRTREQAVGETTLRFVFRAALDRQMDIWIQAEAMGLLRTVSPDTFATVVKERLDQPAEGDDIFLRRRAVELLADAVQSHPQLLPMIGVAVTDPSAYVRITAAKACTQYAASTAMPALAMLALKDSSPQVRGASLLEVATFFNHPEADYQAREIYRQILKAETDTFVVRVALLGLVQGTERLLKEGRDDEARTLVRAFRGPLERLLANAELIKIRRWVAETSERLRVLVDPKLNDVMEALKKLSLSIPAGGSRNIPARIVRGVSEHDLGRILSVLAQTERSLSIGWGALGSRLYRGERKGFRFWRFLHELLNPSPDKRQAYTHTDGRIFQGQLRAPSAIMSELTQTKVPGEPLKLSSESGWCPWLPLPGEILQMLASPPLTKSVKIYSAQGVTELIPKWWARRLPGALVLALRFSRYARLRNWSARGKVKHDDYVRSMRKLGVDIRFTPHGKIRDASVHRFFPSVFAAGEEFWRSARDYFFSLYGNTLFDLGVFTSSLLVVFLGSRIVLHRSLKQARQQIPLVVGGWGTRGKSGTERLKAALFEGIGEALVSKTTGCEALFLYSYPFGKTREMFLFRPFDKATIWEHHDLLRRSVRLKSSIFLWECMGLTPDYVKILQRDWTRDDYSTITNTYPDHEDIQGPAGTDIPEVMTRFIPKNGVLVTSEEEMLPILTDSAHSLGTRVVTTGWLEAGLLTPDVMDRFPYSEHPMNVALVLGMSREMGIKQDFALYEMAARVIPDIGVLKAFPPAPLQGRVLEFTNGMSANERLATKSNWERMGFEKQDRAAAPGVFLTTVVNNRADRLSRTIMFASILVNDLSADRHVLIGSNLGGLQGFITEMLNEYLDRLRSEEDQPGIEVLKEVAQKMRVPTDGVMIKERLGAMLQSLAPDDFHFVEQAASLWDAPQELQTLLEDSSLKVYATGIADHIQAEVDDLALYQSLSIQAAGGTDRKLREHIVQAARQWFEKKIHIVESYEATGEEVIQDIIEITPPGIFNRVMGVQNIKGTGLDFVYRWQAWETCYNACQDVLSKDDVRFKNGLGVLSVFQEYGILCEETVDRTVETALGFRIAQNEREHASLMFVQSTARNAAKQIRQSMGHRSSGGVMGIVAQMLEALLDAGDAVSRRKSADKIYKDLENERISHELAAVELKELNRRQKGGWLRRSLEGLVNRSGRNLK